MTTTRREPFDPAKSDDPVAQKTEWTPASGGGASFRTHGLVVRGERARFRASLGMVSFAGVFFTIGMVFIVVTPRCVTAIEESVNEMEAEAARKRAEADDAVDEIASEAEVEREEKIPIEESTWIIYYPFMGFGVLFAGAGLLFFYRGARPATFHKGAGIYYKGYLPPRRMEDIVPPRAAKLADIHAIQLISEHCSGTGSSPGFTSHELNIVLHDGRRANVIDHGTPDRLRRDAAALGEFLGVPVWDASE